MKVAITYENEQVFGHFGQTKEFVIYDIEDSKIVSKKMLSDLGIDHCGMIDVLKQAGIEVLICGGIGPGAINACNSLGISVVPGVEGNVDEVINAYINSTLVFDPEARCHHEDGHDCHH